jgi:TonB family protein
MRTPTILLLGAFGVFAQDAREILNRGVADFKNARYSEAIANFQKAVDLDPGFTTARLYLATAWMQQYIPGAENAENANAFRHAEAEFKAVLAQDAASHVARASLASLYLNTKRWDDARAEYRTLLNYDPKAVDAYYSLGFIAWSQWYPPYAAARAAAGLRPETPGPIPDPAARASLRAQWSATLEEGIWNLSRALELSPQYSDAMAYMNLLIRERADLRDTKEECQRDIAEADQWVAKALAAKKAQAEMRVGMTVPPPPPPPPPPSGRIVVGSDVHPAELVSRVPPVYPQQAKDAKVEGAVSFRALIDKQGRVTNLTVLSGHPLLVPAALEAVKQWVYRPTLMNGEPVEVSTQIDVNFSLRQ